jgi:protein-L-isoaspartate(D-aspartate) O-methyltransferase
MYMLAFRLLELDAGHRYLELGTGTGYGAALAAHVVGRTGHVTTVDVDAGLIADAPARAAAGSGIEFLHDDGMLRADLIASHDRCWVTFSISEVPQALLDAAGGRKALGAGRPGAAESATLLALHARSGRAKAAGPRDSRRIHSPAGASGPLM